MATEIQKSTDQPTGRLPTLLTNQQIRSRFDDVLGDRSAAFISSIISATKANPALEKCEPMSVISAAMIAASLDLPINPSLGMAHIVPYGDQATFQMGHKGFVQLAMRTGQYKTINHTVVYEGQLVRYNQFTGEYEFQDARTSDTVVGYLLYFKLLNGFEKYYYMTADKMKEHGKRFSKSYSNKNSRWQQDFDAMGLKTVIKMGLSKYGILSIEMQKAIETDESSEGDYPDSTGDKPQLAGTSETRQPRIMAAVQNTGTTIDGEHENDMPPDSGDDII